MAKIVQRAVAVGGVMYKAGDEMPDHHVELVSNPTVFAEPPDEDEAPVVDVTSPSPGYANMTKAELVTLCDERGIDSHGNKTVLIERLEASDAASG